MNREKENAEREAQRQADEQERQLSEDESVIEMAKVAQELIKDPRYEAFRTFFESMMKGYMEMNSNPHLQELEQKNKVWVVKQSMRTGAIDFIRDFLLGTPDAMIERMEEIESSKKQTQEARKSYKYRPGRDK